MPNVALAYAAALDNPAGPVPLDCFWDRRHAPMRTNRIILGDTSCKGGLPKHSPILIGRKKS